MYCQSAFGGMLQYIVKVGSIVLRPEPLDAEIERRCNQAWSNLLVRSVAKPPSSPGRQSLNLVFPTIAMSSPTRNTIFECQILSLGEIVIASVLYADTLLSIPQIA